MTGESPTDPALPEDLTPDEMAERLERYNTAYRDGVPLVSDAAYDGLVERLREAAPDHPFLQAVEPEQFPAKRRIRHPSPMLSTEKAYTVADLERFVTRVARKADELGRPALTFRATAKLDGLAARDDGEMLVSRGDGLLGYDITSALEKGVVPVGGRGLGLGEIVMARAYFERRLSERFDHPRNLVVGIVSSDTVNEAARQALADGAVRFVPYARLDAWTGTAEALVAGIDGIYADLTRIDYPVDGIVIEVTDDRLRREMGATAHHHRWQIAYKRRGDTAVTTVEAVNWQVGRTGNVTPVMAVTPVSLSGATIRRVTAHNAGNVARQAIGTGARIEIIRSGEVIPKIVQVIEASRGVRLPAHCPSCRTRLEWQDPFLRCPNSQACRDQIVQRIRHWFHTIGNADWFGVKSVERLVDAGCATLAKIYDMRADDYQAVGFGPGQSANLAQAVQLSRSQPLADWRFLAAFGLPHLGLGDSRRLLQAIPLELLFDVDAEQISRIYGFAELTGRGIADEVRAQSDQIRAIWQRGFNLERTPAVAVDFVVALGLFESMAPDAAKRSKKERIEQQQTAAAALLQNGSLVELAALETGEILLRLSRMPVAADDCRKVAERVAWHGDTLQQAASLPLEWIYPAAAAPETAGALSGKRLVFTGRMATGSREAMQADARRRGATVQSAVGGQTDYLICGEKVGAAKMDKARRLGVRVISEAEYLALAGGAPQEGGNG